MNLGITNIFQGQFFTLYAFISQNIDWQLALTATAWKKSGNILNIMISSSLFLIKKKAADAKLLALVKQQTLCPTVKSYRGCCNFSLNYLSEQPEFVRLHREQICHFRFARL